MFGFERMGLHVGRFLPPPRTPHQLRPPDGITRAGSHLCCVIEREGALALDVVVPALSERIVGADQDLVCVSPPTGQYSAAFLNRKPNLERFVSDILLPPTTGQLDRGQLLLVVLLERWSGFLEEGRIVFGQGLDVCGALNHGSRWMRDRGFSIYR